MTIKNSSGASERLVGVGEAPGITDVDLDEELQRTRVFASPTNS